MYIDHGTCIQRSDGASIPLDPSNADYAAYLEWIAAGNVPDMPPQPTHAELVEQAIDQIRVERQPILGVLDGLQATSLTKSDTPTAVVIETAKQALRDLTKIDLSACETLAEMKVAVLTRYAQIASASPALKSAFTEAIR